MSEPRLFVPVQVSACATALRLFRTAAGKRTAVAFTSPLQLAKVLGSGQRWVQLTEPALRSMIVDVGVLGIVVDPAGATPSPVAGVA